MDISGIFPPIPTPFNKDEEIDYVKLKENVKKWNEIPFKGTQEHHLYCSLVDNTTLW
jgi:hypothetical protein